MMSRPVKAKPLYKSEVIKVIHSFKCLMSYLEESLFEKHGEVISQKCS